MQYELFYKKSRASFEEAGNDNYMS